MIEAMASRKRRRVEHFPDSCTAADAAQPEAAGGDDEEQQGDRQEKKSKAVSLQLRRSQVRSSNKKQSSRENRNLVDPRQQSIKKFIQVKDVKIGV